MLADIMKIGGVLGAMAMVLTACAGSVPRREAVSSVFMGEQGSSGELLFASPDLPAISDLRGEQELARADGRLNIRRTQALVAGSQWPEPERASLENARSVYIRDRDDRFTYFGADRLAPRRSYRWDGR